MDNMNEYGVRDFDYFSLVRMSDNKEVYTSPAYAFDGDVLDFHRIGKTLNYYFERVNGHLMQQLQSPRLTMEEKISIKLLDVEDYVVKFKKFTPNGMAEIVYWTKPAKTYCNSTI